MLFHLPLGGPGMWYWANHSALSSHTKQKSKSYKVQNYYGYISDITDFFVSIIYFSVGDINFFIWRHGWALFDMRMDRVVGVSALVFYGAVICKYIVLATTEEVII